ncbi:hypothetical protein CP973_21630 [Streptomyces albofaciens JCM 4342]|uniref:sensor histidine kinase n=1 Tax=Streptomyces albofaciens TaxID=66866 RepID=UPI0012398064|nr:hypothetical protein [Streptomyces albofaciens]KAA6212078.1 hypothetical protein CP973_21630 [Streptomyces albofaciens JCM 4342]
MTAVEALAERAPLPVAVDVPAQRWPQEAQLALYYVVTEGLANVYRHAGASRAEIRITHFRGKLILELSDDGRGGAGLMARTGLRGLQDRVGALGGTLVLYSPRDAGTRLTVELPCA